MELSCKSVIPQIKRDKTNSSTETFADDLLMFHYVTWTTHTHLQFPDVLQVVEGAPGNRSYLRLLNFPVDTETVTHSQWYIDTRNVLADEKSFNFVVCSGPVKPTRLRLVTHSCWGFSFHAQSKLFCIQNVYTRSGRSRWHLKWPSIAYL